MRRREELVSPFKSVFPKCVTQDISPDYLLQVEGFCGGKNRIQDLFFSRLGKLCCKKTHLFYLVFFQTFGHGYDQMDMASYPPGI